MNGIGNELKAQVANYSLTASSGTFTPLVGGTTMTLSGGNTDDGYWNNIPIGFIFPYAGINYTTAAGCTNGWLSLVGPMTQNSWTNNLSGGITVARPVLAPLWDDHDGTGITFTWKSEPFGVSGDSVFTAQWLNIDWQFTGGPNLSVQVKLFKNSGKIQFIYRQESTPIGTFNSASIGISGVATGAGNFLSLNNTGTSPTASSTTETTTINTLPATGQIYEFNPPVPALPIVATGTKTNVLTNTVTLAGSIGVTTFPLVSSSGIVVGTSPSPVIGGFGVIDSTTNPLVTSGSFTKNIAGLSNSTTYFYRAYAINSIGTNYGPDSTFTTTAGAVLASINRNASSAVLATTATVGGTIINDGGAAITTSGVVFGTTSLPAIGSLGVLDSVTTPNVTIGAFNFNLAGLAHSTKYYYRAYAINSVGIAYSTQDSFTTAPVVSALPYSQNFDVGGNSGWTTASINGRVNSWALGTPAKTFINGSYSAPNSYVTRLAGNYGNLGDEEGALVSPQFDFTGVNATPVLRFRNKHKTDLDPGWDCGIVEISINNGPWTRLDNTTGTGANFNTVNSTAWHNLTNTSGFINSGSKFTNTTSAYSSQVNGWIQSVTPLTGAAGQSNVKFRFHFAADVAGTDEGWAIDDIEVLLPTTPVVVTGTKTNVTTLTATLAGNITSNGNAAVTASGVVFSTTPAPTIGSFGVIDSTTNPLTATGTFTKNIEGLNNSTTYYYRAYATNTVGTSYGADSTFTTPAAATVATINRNVSSAIQATTATVGGTIVNNGGNPITISGVVFGTTSLPAIGGLGVVDSVTTPNVAAGSFNFNLAGLTHSTKYYYRAYAINSIGTAYSTQDSFITAPIVSALPYSQNFDSVGTTGFNSTVVTGTNNDWVVGTPTKTTLNGAFSAPNAWVTKLTGNFTTTGNINNSAVVSPQFDFTGQTADPILRFQHRFRLSSFGAGSDVAVIEISINNGAWTRLDNNFGTGLNFNSANGSTAWYNGPNNGWSSTTTTGAAFSTLSSAYNSQVNGWIQTTTRLTGAAGQSNVRFRMRMDVNTFGGSDEGWEFDNVEVFPPTAPVVVTGTKTNITTNNGTLAGNITSNGNSLVTASGVVFSTSPAPTRGSFGVIDSATNPLTALGIFTKNIAGLFNSTTYYYRAYAVNAVGTSYGADSTFTTPASAIIPTVLRVAASNLTTTTVTLGGNITSNGGDPVTVSGIVYSTTPNPAIGGGSVVDSTTTPLVAAGTYSINPTGLSHSTKYYFRAYAINSVGTAYSTQDSFTTSPIVSILPYSQNFDGVGNTGWTTLALNGRVNSWELGTPVKTFINGAYSAPNSFVTKLVGNYGGSGDEEAALVSPQFDFSSTNADPVLRFRNKHKTNNDPGWDCGVVEISINNGPWTRLNNQTGTGTNFNTLTSHAWHNLTNTSGFINSGSKFTNTTATYASQVNGWVESATRLTGAGGQSNVKVRFHFAADAAGVDEGWAIDDIQVVNLITPTISSTSVVLTPNINGGAMNVAFAAGNGQERLVVARLTSNPAVAPLDTLFYQANSVFNASSPNNTGTGNIIVYKGAGTSVNVTGLTNFTNYAFDVYEYNGKYMHNKFTVAATSSAQTLPVKLISFNGIAKNNDALLTWVTASETNNKGFEVERSIDGRTFELVNFVKGAGNSNKNLNYTLTDANVLSKFAIVYYRLKQIDFDGKTTLSQVVRVTKNAESMNSMIVFPNPFNNEYNVSFNAAKAGMITLETVNLEGKVIVIKTTAVTQGANTVPVVEAANLSAGVYFVRLTIDGETQVMKLVKN
ncbi:MAG: T9SS type A sorting domain-containing protein [Bacteroidia bacterium]|nr:T9SS type A sorting domain-containing protein [Bacteroidia bacterium]